MCMYVYYIYIYIYISKQTNIHTYIHTYIHVCIYIYTYIHTYAILWLNRDYRGILLPILPTPILHRVEESRPESPEETEPTGAS